MKWITDPTRRFPMRPLYELDEMESESEVVIANALEKIGVSKKYPLTISDLSKILDFYTTACDYTADLTSYGEDVEGLTQFFPDKPPYVSISKKLEGENYTRRRKMTIAHELGHVHLHSILFKMSQDPIFGHNPQASTHCKRSTISRGGDWMEWQAGFAAGAILMPKRLLQSTILKNFSLKTPLAHDGQRAKDLAITISDEFEVSKEAAWVRLLQLGYIQPATPRSSTLS